mgnify:CR=1 FL=1
MEELETQPWYSFTTRDYKLHYLETLTGLRFALTTDPSVGRVTDVLTNFYKMYVELVVKCPLHKPGDFITVPLFISKLEQTVENLPFYLSKPTATA